MRSWVLSVVLGCGVGFGLVACGAPSAAVEDGSSSSGGGKADTQSAAELPAPPASAHAVLDLYALDLWAQPLPHDATLTIEYAGRAIAITSWPIVRVPLDQAGAIVVKLTAPLHDPIELRLGYDGSDTLDGLVINSAIDPANGVSLGRNRHDFGPRSLPVHSLYLGLRHQYFSAQGRPARRGNELTLFIDGEHAWESVARDLDKATESIAIATWWFESNFELVRPKDGHIELTPSQRQQNTILAHLEKSPATKRLLINQLVQQDGVISDLTSDAAVRLHGPNTNDNFELLGQHNTAGGSWSFSPSTFRFAERVATTTYASDHPIFDSEPTVAINLPSYNVDASLPLDLPIDAASMHQKFAVLDQKVAYIGGMNLRRVDWDTAEHKIFEPRRALFDTSRADRDAIDLGQKRGELGPRKDYMVRIEGPAVQDASDVFHRRWAQAISDNVENAWAATDFSVARQQPAKSNGTQVQVTATLPYPYNEQAIGESWLNAIAHAEKYIYIEDQYFRAELLNDAILQRMLEKPDLVLVVITKPINEWTDLGCEWTYRTNDLFKDFGGRYFLMQLRSFDYGWDIDGHSDDAKGFFADMDVHSKMLIVDDVFLSVGSANKNNRGMIYEAELNLAVVDPSLVKSWRRRIVQNLLPPSTAVADIASDWMLQLRRAAAHNDLAYSLWEGERFTIDFHGEQPADEYLPRGFAYSMDLAPVAECAVEGISADLM